MHGEAIYGNLIYFSSPALLEAGRKGLFYYKMCAAEQSAVQKGFYWYRAVRLCLKVSFDDKIVLLWCVCAGAASVVLCCEYIKQYSVEHHCELCLLSSDDSR